LRRRRMMGRRIEPVIDRHAASRAEASATGAPLP
jgi:hypothetical protein